MRIHSTLNCGSDEGYKVHSLYEKLHSLYEKCFIQKSVLLLKNMSLHSTNMSLLPFDPWYCVGILGSWQAWHSGCRWLTCPWWTWLAACPGQRPTARSRRQWRRLHTGPWRACWATPKTRYHKRTLAIWLVYCRRSSHCFDVVPISYS